MVRPAALLELEDLLSNHLDTRVQVSMGAKRGRVVVDFATLEDLERIYRVIVEGAEPATEHGRTLHRKWGWSVLPSLCANLWSTFGRGVSDDRRRKPSTSHRVTARLVGGAVEGSDRRPGAVPNATRPPPPGGGVASWVLLG